jgi:transposase
MPKVIKMIRDPFLREQLKRMRKKKGLTEYQLLLKAIKRNKLKRVDKRLQVVKLCLEGLTHKEIADKLDYSREWVCKLVNQYKSQGLTEFARHKYGGNNRALSVEEEIEILQQFEEESQQGKLVVANSIKKAFDKKRGKDTGRAYIYSVIKRHTARKVAPRPAHLKKASPEAMEASKKLTSDTGN